MTAYRCCPGCGAELPTTDQHAAAGCVCTGPFTEVRDDPLHIRPYVDLPGSVDSGDTGPESGTAGERPQPDLTPFARCGTAETAELPAVPAQSATREQSGTSEQSRRHRAAAGARRRRPGNAVLAGAGMAAALGAGLLCANVLTGSDSGGDNRSLSAGDRATDPEPELGSGQAPTREYPSGERANPRSSPASSAADGPQARSAPEVPRADRDSNVHTAPPTPSHPASTPSASTTGDPAEHPDRGTGPSASSAGTGGDRAGGDRSTPRTLRAGDSGAQVRELQQRLKQAGFLDQDVPEDGEYSAVVQEAVFRYQTANGVRGDTAGEYGPRTRTSLESRTSG